MTIINNALASIDTTTSEISVGQILVSADRRGTKEKPLSDSERIRRVVLPANQWGNLTAASDSTPMQGLTDVLRNALRDIASAKLKDTLAENPLQRTVALKDYSIGALLAWNEDTASSRGSITFTREQVEAWYPTSAIYQAMVTKGTQWIDFLGKRLATLAAKNHGLKKPEDADKLVLLLEADANSSIGSELIQRLSHISRSLTSKSTETLSLDDL